jgi:hypothetical protein
VVVLTSLTYLIVSNICGVVVAPEVVEVSVDTCACLPHFHSSCGVKKYEIPQYTFNESESMNDFDC